MSVGCATSTDNGTSTTTGSGGAEPTTSSSSSSGGGSNTNTGGTGGDGGGVAIPCGQDCSKIQTPPCLTAVCNEGQYVGTVGACVVIESPAGTACDDGQFCTVGDACDGDGACVGGAQNDCGMTAPECHVIGCDETFKTCGPLPAGDGASCSPTDLCQVNGVCKDGTCKGEPKDCSFSPLTECNTVACNPSTGLCEPTADPGKNGQKCNLTGDLCLLNRTCDDGKCAGGTPKNCTALTSGCTNGVCDSTTGTCVAEPVPVGGTCYDSIDQCHVGVCDASMTCQAQAVPDGTPCNDNNACTAGDVCTAGVCGGTPSTGCTVYYKTSFEACPDGWTFGGDWQCGTPTSGPELPHSGLGLIATQLGGDYSASQTYDTAVADSTIIDLSGATAPKLSFWVWMNTEGGTYDGFNLKVSANGGTSYTLVTAVTPAYPLTISSEKAWGGDQSAEGWVNYVADLSAYAGQQIKLRFAFRSSASGQRAGVYIDDVVVAEPSAIPLQITSKSLPDAVADHAYTAVATRSGGSNSAAWSIIGGSNSAWLTIDPATGALSGAPTAADLGPASVAVRVEELAVPGNAATKTFKFNVVSAVHYQNFEGACPNGWTLASDWQCGTPSGPGPGAAYGGSQCLATKLTGNYSDSLSYATAIATSPDIDLTGTTAPKLRFRMWVHTENGFDGANLKISSDGGATYTTVTNTVPPYDDTDINGEPAWTGNLSAMGWRLVQANLAAYAGKTIRLRFAFRTDASGVYPGVYIDDILITD